MAPLSLKATPPHRGVVTQHLHLVTDDLTTRLADPGATAVPLSVAVPQGATNLTITDEGLAVLVAEAPDDGSPSWRVEALHHEAQPQLLVVSTQQHRLTVNGQPAPVVTLLRPGDHVQTAAGGEFFLALYDEPRIGPPAPLSVGQECLLCRVRFEKTSTVYRCWYCDTHFHLEGADGLDCGRVTSECLHCQKPVRLERGFSHYPSDLAAPAAVDQGVAHVAQAH